MKKNLFLLVLLNLLISCQSESKIIKEFLSNEIDDDTLKSNVLIKQKISFSESLRILQGMNIKIKTEEEIKIYSQLKIKYKKDKNENWSFKDLKLNDIEIIDKDSVDDYLNNRRKKLTNKYYADKFNLYNISKPYFFEKSQKVFFNISKVRFFNNKLYNDVIVMEKKNGKWVVINKISNNDL